VQSWHLEAGDWGVGEDPVGTCKEHCCSRLHPGRFGPGKLRDRWNHDLEHQHGRSHQHSFRGRFLTLAFSPNGKLLASAVEDNTTKVWRWDTNQGVLSLGAGSTGVRRLAFSHNSELLATGSNDGSLKLWNPRNGEPVGSLEGHGSSICGLAYSNDGALLVVCIMKPFRLLPWSKKGVTDEFWVTSRHPVTVPCRSGRQRLGTTPFSTHSTWVTFSDTLSYLLIQDCLLWASPKASLRYTRQPLGN